MGRIERAWKALLRTPGWWLPPRRGREEVRLARVTFVETDTAATYCVYCLLERNLEARALGDRRYFGIGKVVICDDHELITLRHYARRQPWERQRIRGEREETSEP